MTKKEQRKLLRDFCNNVRNTLLERSHLWPQEWDGHELRELAAYAFDHERTRLMRENKKRARDASNEIAVRNLYRA